MHTRISALVLAAVLALSLNAAHTSDIDYTDVVDSAFAAVEWNVDRDWAFTETSFEDESLRIGRFDPRRPEGERWQLLSFDNRPPSIEEIEAYLEDKQYDQGDHQRDEDGVGSFVDRATLALEKETHDYWLFSFVPIPDDDDEDFMRKLQGTLKISKQGGRLEYLDIRNHRPIRPMLGTKLKKLIMRFDFDEAVSEGPTVLVGVNVEVEGSALLLMSFSETETFTFSDFEYVGDELD